MIFYCNFRGKTTIDRLVLLLFLSYCLLNVCNQLIVEIAGGLGNIMIVYLFAFYFAFVYGEPIDERTGRIQYVPLILFLLFYILEMQFLYSGAQYYNAMGVNFETHVWQIVSFVPLCLCAIFIVKKTEKDVTWLRTAFLCLLLITLIPSIVMLANDSTLSKQTATGNGEYIPLLVNYSKIYGLAIIVPFFFATTKSRLKLLEVVVGVAVILCIYLSSFFIAVMAMILGFIVCLILRIKNNAIRRFLIVSAVGVILFLLYSGVAQNILFWLSENISSELLSTRFFQLANYLQTGDTGDTTVRIDLYTEAIKLVLKHPISGNLLWGDVQLSGHSGLLDVWGALGIFSIVGLLLFFSSVYRVNCSFCQTVKASSALKASVIVFLFVSLTNPVFSSPTICVLWILAPMIFENE